MSENSENPNKPSHSPDEYRTDREALDIVFGKARLDADRDDWPNKESVSELFNSITALCMDKEAASPADGMRTRTIPHHHLARRRFARRRQTKTMTAFINPKGVTRSEPDFAREEIYKEPAGIINYIPDQYGPDPMRSGFPLGWAQESIFIDRDGMPKILRRIVPELAVALQPGTIGLGMTAIKDASATDIETAMTALAEATFNETKLPVNDRPS